MNAPTLPLEALQQALSVRDLSDPTQGPHALQLLADSVHAAVAARCNCPRQLHRGSRLVTSQDHFSRLGYEPNPLSARFVSEELLLRAHTTALLPPLLSALALDPPEDVLLVCPGVVYRRGRPDALHAAEPHQLDLCRLSRRPLGPQALGELARTAMAAALPGQVYRLLPSPRPHLRHAMRIDAQTAEGWLELGHCGLLAPETLSACGQPREMSALAMDLSLDRLLMLRKGLPDVRLLRSAEPAVAEQMLDLMPYRPPVMAVEA